MKFELKGPLGNVFHHFSLDLPPATPPFGAAQGPSTKSRKQPHAKIEWEYFSRLRRAEIGIRHHIAGAYLPRYAQESSWREDNRRVSNGDQVSHVAALAMKRGKSVDFTGYWQRHIAD